VGHVNLGGLVPLLGGIYCLLVAYRVIPISRSKDPEKVELWHRKFGKPMKILASLLIVFGILELLRIP